MEVEDRIILYKISIPEIEYTYYQVWRINEFQFPGHIYFRH